jgi:hypothetical protein
MKNDTREQISEGLRRTYKKLKEEKKKNNQPLVVSKDGKVIIIPAKDIELED